VKNRLRDTTWETWSGVVKKNRHQTVKERLLILADIVEIKMD